MPDFCNIEKEITLRNWSYLEIKDYFSDLSAIQMIQAVKFNPLNIIVNLSTLEEFEVSNLIES